MTAETNLRKYFFDETSVAVLSDGAVFREQLSAEIEYLLRHNMNKLLGILYRVDVAEQKVEVILRESSSEREIAGALADLIWEREQKKEIWRLKYHELLNTNNPSSI